jgi:hypothetical protein
MRIPRVCRVKGRTTTSEDDAGPKPRRRQEWRRGTHECVRHNALRGAGPRLAEACTEDGADLPDVPGHIVGLGGFTNAVSGNVVSRKNLARRDGAQGIHQGIFVVIGKQESVDSVLDDLAQAPASAGHYGDAPQNGLDLLCHECAKTRRVPRPRRWGNWAANIAPLTGIKLRRLCLSRPITPPAAVS